MASSEDAGRCFALPGLCNRSPEPMEDRGGVIGTRRSELTESEGVNAGVGIYDEAFFGTEIYFRTAGPWCVRPTEYHEDPVPVANESEEQDEK